MARASSYPDAGAVTATDKILGSRAGVVVNFDPDDLAGYPLSPAGSRTELAAVSATIDQVRYLSEIGREGWFKFKSSDLSAQVSADTAQGIYVAPASGPTGSSGGWVRQFDGAINPSWFGLSTANTGADNSLAIAAMMACLKVRGLAVATNYRGLERVRIPVGQYNIGSTIEITEGTMILEGDTTPGGDAAATYLVFPAGVTGIRVQTSITSGATGAAVAASEFGDGSIIRNLFLGGGYAGTEGEYHGIQLRGRAIIQHVGVTRFEGDGIHIEATAGDGTYEGNANNFHIAYCRITACRDGVFVKGADANAGTGIGIDCSSNRRWGINDRSFLGNTWIGCHTASNGLITGVAPSIVSNGGNRYAVVDGAEATASVTAPSGTADTANWLYIGAGGVSTGQNIPAWVSGMSLRAGGAYHTDNANARSGFNDCYSESGQGPSQIVTPANVRGGQLASLVRGTCGWIYQDLGVTVSKSSFYTLGNITVDGFVNRIGATTGTATDNAIELANTNAFTKLNFNSYLSGSLKNDGVIASWRNSAGGLIFVGNPTLYFESGTAIGSATIIGQIDTTGLRIVSGSLGYGTGAGGAVTQATSRTTSVQVDKACGSITLVSAAGTTSWQSFTVNCNKVAATDVVRVVQKSGTDKYMIFVTAVGSGSFEITFSTTGGTTTEQPVFNFSVIKGVAS